MAAPLCRRLGCLVQKGLSYGLPKYNPSIVGIRQLSVILSTSTGKTGLVSSARLPVSTVTPNTGFLPAVGCINKGSLLKACLPCYNSSRNLVRYSLRKGKRKTVKPVIRRFYRLDWGIWIRPRAGRGRRVWTKSPRMRLLARHHVFCNKTQSRMLDKMVTPYWKKKNNYIDDPYEPYHKRTGMDHFSEFQKPRWYP